MAIHIIEGDLLKSDCNVIAHCANCYGVMGAGIARQIASKYPKALEEDRAFNDPPEYKLGKYSYAVYDNLVIFNLYGQLGFGRGEVNFDPEAFKKSLEAMVHFLKDELGAIINNDLKIGLPHGIGAGLAGGDWNEIYGIIQDVSTEFYVDFNLYKL